MNPYTWCPDCNKHVNLIEGEHGMECSKCGTIIQQRRYAARGRRIKAPPESVKSWAAQLRKEIATK
jgi:tRNA(Ile2) C34 agmatinyltransferase TiaS